MAVLGELTRAAVSDTASTIARLAADGNLPETPPGTRGVMPLKRGQSLLAAASGKVGDDASSTQHASPGQSHPPYHPHSVFRWLGERSRSPESATHVCRERPTATKPPTH